MRSNTSSCLALILFAALTLRPAFGQDFPAPRNSEPASTGPMPAAEAAKGFRVPRDSRSRFSPPSRTFRTRSPWRGTGAGGSGSPRITPTPNRPANSTSGSAIASWFLKTTTPTDTSTAARFLPTTCRCSPVSRSASAACGCYARPDCYSSQIEMAMTFPTGQPKPCSTASQPQPRTTTPSPTACAGAPTAGCMAAAAHPRRARSEPPGRPKPSACPSAAASGAYDTRRKRFEALAHGTTNPWGHDWNALGELFFVNTVNGHLWHMIPGAHFVRPHTIDPNPRAYAQIDQHADHWHWDQSRPLILGAAHAEDSSRGGGHAHCERSIYLAGQWPASYRGRLLTLNFHGRRMNVDRLERAGSGYAGRHEPDFLVATDPWFRGIDLGYGPDGGVFVLDWCDTGDCHDRDGVHRTSGRIYKLAYGTPKPVPAGDLARLSQGELVALHRHPNEWFARQARRVLAERSARGEALVEAKRELRALFTQDSDPVRKLRALWSLYNIGAADESFLRSLLDHEHESVRAWAIRLLTDHLPLDSVFSRRIGPDVDLPADLRLKLTTMARDDPSGLVRLVLASTLQRLPVNRRLALAEALVSHAEDATDHNLPALIWTGLIAVADADPAALASFAPECRQPEVVRLIARRLGEDIESRPGPIDSLLAAGARQSEAFQSDVAAGLLAALAGYHKAKKPPAWDAFQATFAATADPAFRARVRELNVLFGDGRALEEVKRLALDENAELEARTTALQTLIASRPIDLRAICERLVRVRHLNVAAVRGLVLFDDPAIGRTLARNYRSFHPTDRPAVLEALVSRPAFARALLDQLAAGKIARSDLTPFHARQISSLGDPALRQQLSDVWGALRVSPADRRERIRQLKERLDGLTLARGDRSQGRVIYDRVCGTCHKLHGNGGEIGPDLTGSGRDNLDYLLENIVNPSAAVSADYRMVVVALNDGRVLNGLLKRQTDRTVALQTQTEAIVVERSEIASLRPSPSSLMPDGLLDTLSTTEIRDLIAYLSQPTQAPLPRGRGDGIRKPEQ